MYGMRMVFGGWSGPRFEAALERALARLGHAVATRAVLGSREDYYRWLAEQRHGEHPGEPPSLFFHRAGELHNGPAWLGLEVRGVRPPPWNLRLARAASEALGGFGLVYANDRLRDEYGHGTFFAGCTLEAVARDVYGVRVRLGVDPTLSERAVHERCDEDENREQYDRYVRAIAAPGDWPSHEAADAPLTAWSLRPAPELADDSDAEPATVRVVIAGGDEAALRQALQGAAGRFESRIDPAWPLHDPFDFDPETHELVVPSPAWYLSLRAPVGVDPGPLLDRAAGLGLVAVAVELRGGGRPFRFWSRAADGVRREGEASGAEHFFAAWAPVCDALATGAAQLCWPEDAPDLRAL